MAPTIFDDVDAVDVDRARGDLRPGPVGHPVRHGGEALDARQRQRLRARAVRSGRRDLDRAIRVARRLRVGDVWVNTHYVRLAESPFGGVKQSGIGRELGMEGLDAYLESKRVCIDSSPTFHIR